MRANYIVLLGIALGLLLSATPGAYAGPFIDTPNTRANFVTPGPGDEIPFPQRVPGKEYSGVLDMNAIPPIAPTPLQVIRWDGYSPGGVTNGFNYSGTFQNPVGTSIPNPGSQIDALANSKMHCSRQ
jgi:hypothetical protein